MPEMTLYYGGEAEETTEQELKGQIQSASFMSGFEDGGESNIYVTDVFANISKNYVHKERVFKVVLELYRKAKNQEEVGFVFYVAETLGIPKQAIYDGSINSKRSS